MTKIEELLAVLDMSEDEQENALWEIYSPDYYCCLADLAFRLRDEARKCSDVSLATAWAIVYKNSCADARNTEGDIYIWWLWNAKPIHWIIAALIAKEQSNGH